MGFSTHFRMPAGIFKLFSGKQISCYYMAHCSKLRNAPCIESTSQKQLIFRYAKLNLIFETLLSNGKFEQSCTLPRVMET